MTETPLRSLNNWFQREAEKEAKKDVLKPSDRFGNLFGLIMIVIILVFFAVHLSSETGFFTSSFGTLSAIIFFGSTAWGMIASGIRLFTGKKSPSKIFDIFGSIFVLISVVYFLASFEFDFTHVADPLPDYLQGILQWMTDDFVKIIMTIAAVVLPFVIPYQFVSYRYLRMALSNQQTAPAVPADTMQNQEAPKQ